MKRKNLFGLLLIVFMFFSGLINAQDKEYKLLKDIPYYDTKTTGADNYIKEQCNLDLYYPKDKDHYATIVWFHGGGLRSGHKEIPEYLKEKGVAVVGVEYRFFPKVKAPKYIEDAAAAVSWVFNHINEYGGDSTLIFVSGHSAGGYLTSMIGMDKAFLAKYNIDANRIAGLIPLSGHTITHFTVREERGIPGTQPIVDDLAPLYYVRADAPPILLITGDREMEMLGRYEENAYFYRMMKVVGDKDIKLYEMDGYGHNMVEPAMPLLLKFVNQITDQKKK